MIKIDDELIPSAVEDFLINRYLGGEYEIMFKFPDQFWNWLPFF